MYPPFMILINRNILMNTVDHCIVYFEYKTKQKEEEEEEEFFLSMD